MANIRRISGRTECAGFASRNRLFDLRSITDLLSHSPTNFLGDGQMVCIAVSSGLLIMGRIILSMNFRLRREFIKENKNSTKTAIKETRKQELNQESG